MPHTRRFSDPDAAGPCEGDVLVAKDNTGADRTMYTLSVVPGPPQVRCPTYEEAVLTATLWASRQVVAVWFTEDGKEFEPVPMV